MHEIDHGNAIFVCHRIFPSLHLKLLSSTQEEDSLVSLPYQYVFILQGEVGALFNMGCCVLFVPHHPHPSSSSLVYLHLPSLSHFKAP